MRRDQRPVQVEPIDPADIPRGIEVESLDLPGVEPPPAHPVSHRQAQQNQQLASMKLEREAMAHRFANLAENDYARVTAAETLKRHDETIARFEQALAEGM